jgi:adenylate cyclase
MLSSNAPLLYFLLISLTAMSLDLRLCAVAGVTAAAGHALATLLASAEVSDPWVRQGLSWMVVTSPHYVVVRGILYVTAGAAAGFVAVLIQRQMQRALAAADEHSRAIGIFGRHVSPQVVDLLVRKGGVLEGEERHVCVMFLDIRDFSRFASGHTPAEVLTYLNTLFNAAIPIVVDKGGIVNKLLGDGFMAVFGAPLHDEECCVHGVETAQEILRRVDEMIRSGRLPPTRIGIGLHYGRVITGNVGGEERMEYTVVGDVVNVAARVEQATKSLDARLLLSDAVLAASPAVARLRPQEIGPVELKGQDQPVRLYKLA